MVTAKINGKKDYQVSFEGTKVLVDGVAKDAEIRVISDVELHVVAAGKSFTVFVEAVKREEKQVLLNVNGKKAEVALTTEMDLLLAKMGLSGMATKKAADIKAPMPGLIRGISVSVGDEVKKGDTVLILEAMKMENIIKSPADGVVKKIAVHPGDSVEKNQLLIAFE
jgi:biotin carboxyl carrier protein